MHRRKGKIQVVQESVHIDSKLTLDLGICSAGGSLKAGAYCNQVTDEILPQVQLTLGPVGPKTRVFVICLVPQCIVEIDICENSQNPMLAL